MARDQIETLGGRVDYDITLEPTRQQWVFALDIPKSWSLPQSFMGPQHQLARTTPIEQRISYKATSYTDYRVQTELSRMYRNWYSSLPEDSNPRTEELAQEMRLAAGTDRDFVECGSAESYARKNSITR